jgi:hypothetical protein
MHLADYWTILLSEFTIYSLAKFILLTSARNYLITAQILFIFCFKKISQNSKASKKAFALRWETGKLTTPFLSFTSSLGRFSTISM